MMSKVYDTDHIIMIHISAQTVQKKLLGRINALELQVRIYHLHSAIYPIKVYYLSFKMQRRKRGHFKKKES